MNLSASVRLSLYGKRRSPLLAAAAAIVPFLSLEAMAQTPPAELAALLSSARPRFSADMDRQLAMLVADGDVPPGDMFQSAQDTNNLIAWIIRVVGLILLMAGFGLILAPLGVLADVLPLAGTIVRMGTGLIGFVLGLIVGTVTIALAWLAFRPVTTIIILAVGGAIAFAVYRFGRGRDRKARAAGATA